MWYLTEWNTGPLQTSSLVDLSSLASLAIKLKTPKIRKLGTFCHYRWSGQWAHKQGQISLPVAVVMYYYLALIFKSPYLMLIRIVRYSEPRPNLSFCHRTHTNALPRHAIITFLCKPNSMIMQWVPSVYLPRWKCFVAVGACCSWSRFNSSKLWHGSRVTCILLHKLRDSQHLPSPWPSTPLSI